jgi:ABC-type nitrate/sulfonate/bicarbonate transport system permease component
MTVAWRRPTTYLAVVIVVIVVWQLLTVTGAVKPILLASPPSVVTQLVALVKTPMLVLEPIGATLGEASLAFFGAIIVAIPLGILIGSSALLRRAWEPLLTTANALPLVILYPVLAATLGVGGGSKIALGALYAFFPVAIATARAAASVDTRLIVASEVMGATRAQLTRNVVLPAITEPIIAGLRVSLALTVVTIIAAEFISGADGVGYQLAASSQGLDTPTLFAWVVIACLFTIVVNVVFSLATNTLLKGIKR